MNIKLSSIRSWSIGSYAKAKYFTAKEQNEENIKNALLEFEFSVKYNTIASFYTDITCIDNPKLNGVYLIKLSFNGSGDTFFEMEVHTTKASYYLSELQNKDIEEYRVVTQGLFETIVDSREFKQFARKATNNIQNCFNDVIEPLYRGTLKISDELDEDVKRTINKLMKIKTRIVSSATSNLSHPEYPEIENM